MSRNHQRKEKKIHPEKVVPPKNDRAGSQLGFLDNRPQTVKQRRLQQLADDRASENTHKNLPQQPVHQLIKVGKEDVTTVARLAVLLGEEKTWVIDTFNAALRPFPAASEQKLNTFLVSKKTKVRKGNLSNPQQYLGILAGSYSRTYLEREGGEFMRSMNTVEEGQNFATLANPDGINYLEGTNDGASLKDSYDSGLACSLFAILELKPGLLGATTPEELHHIFRLDPKTKEYDNDKEVAKIRLSAGLHFHAPAENENTVGKFMQRRTQQDQGKKYIIDPAGQAHTFTLKYSGGRWKQFDNDHPGGIVPGNHNIRVYWTT